MKTSHNLCGLFTPEQVSVLPQSIRHLEMTRRAFSALRVIRLKGKSTSRMAQDFPQILIRKMIIAQNLCVRLAPDQFFYLRQVKTYPEMHPLCLSMRFRKSCQAAKYFFVSQKQQRDFHKKLTFLEIFWEASRSLLGCVRSSRKRFRVCMIAFYVV